MKKLLIVIFILLLSLLAFGCGSTEGQTSPTDANADTAEDSAAEEQEDAFSTAVLDQELMFDAHDVKIYSEDMEYTNSNVTINFVIENNSDNDYDFSAHSFDINRMMMGGNVVGSDINVPSGKKGRLSIEASLSDLEYADALNISEVNIIFWAYKDNFKEWDTGLLTVNTNLDEDVERYLVDPELEDDCVSVSYIEADGTDLIFAVQNKTDYNVDCTFENCSINGWAYEITDYSFDAYNEIINSRAIAIIKLHIDDEFLDKNSIETISDVEFDVLLTDNNWDFEGELFEHKTEKIKLTSE